MAEHVAVMEIRGYGNPENVMRQIKEVVEGRVPEQPQPPDQGGEGENKRPMFFVQLALGRAYKNDIEAHALQHALDDDDDHNVSFIGVLAANPLDENSSSRPTTFVTLTVRADNAEAAEKALEECVTDIVPAPFPILTLRLTELARKDR